MKKIVEHWFSDELKKSGFLNSYPLYTYIVSRFQLRDTADFDVMAVSGEEGQPVLHINLAFFGESSKYLPGVLLHEIHHVVLGHLSDPRYRSASNPVARTIATEISANENICEPLPGEPIRLDHFEHIGILPGQSTWERYELIAAWMNQNQADELSVPPDALGCTEVLSGRSECECSKTGAIDNRVVADLIAGAGRVIDESGQQATIAGRAPGMLLVSLPDVSVLAVGALDWKALLHRFARNGRERVHNYARPNRRFPKRIGEIPGNSRRHNKGRKKLLAVIDTSSSMQAAVVSEIFAELQRLKQHADVTVVECDAAIQRVYPIAQCSGTVRGRGGTDLRPPFEHEFLQNHGPGGIVYFTDGAGPYPEQTPQTPTLWVLTDESPFACPWGQQVRMSTSGIG